MRPLKTYGRKEEAKVERESKPYTFSRILKHKVILTVPKKYTVNILRQSTNTVIKNMRKKIQKRKLYRTIKLHVLNTHLTREFLCYEFISEHA